MAPTIDGIDRQVNCVGKFGGVGWGRHAKCVTESVSELSVLVVLLLYSSVVSCDVDLERKDINA